MLGFIGIHDYGTGSDRKETLFFPPHPEFSFCKDKIKFLNLRNICNFAIADRLAEAPAWGHAVRDVVKIQKKAFIRADS
ncbi:MAG: hypothetical protein K2O56_03205 [Muribaculaceae bacterium]|nr:hypothetical protein [Muribaculaceae bacterium]